jgi:hypothetical protein
VLNPGRGQWLGLRAFVICRVPVRRPGDPVGRNGPDVAQSALTDIGWALLSARFDTPDFIRDEMRRMLRDFVNSLPVDDPARLLWAVLSEPPGWSIYDVPDNPTYDETPLTGDAMTLYAGLMGQNSDDRRARVAARLERMDVDLGPVKRTNAMAPSAWLCLAGLLLFCALFMQGAQRVGWLVFIAVGVLVELAIRRWQKRKR